MSYPTSNVRVKSRTEIDVCTACVIVAANGWDEAMQGEPLPMPEPLSKWPGFIVTSDDRAHKGRPCEGHFSHFACEGCGQRDAGMRYCYVAVKR